MNCSEYYLLCGSRCSALENKKFPSEYFAMSLADVDRVTIDIDHDWETHFIPWLEEMETNYVGVEDGVFVATIDPALRVIQDAGCFLNLSKHFKISYLQGQQLKEFLQKGIFQYSSLKFFKDDCNFLKVAEDFKKSLTLQSFETPTCCTSILEKGEENLLNHFHFDVLNVTKTFAHTRRGFGSTKSVVKLEECGLKLKERFDKYSQNTEEFRWKRSQTAPPKECPDLECSSSEDDENNVISWYGTCYEDPDDSLCVTPKLNLCRIFNILWLLPYHYEGLHSSYLYLGTKHSFFPVHVEDGNLYSLNYLHFGLPKVWVITPPWATELLEFYLHKSCISLEHTACHNILGHKTVVPTICWLKERNTPFKIVVQHPGDLMVLYPSSAHFGFNMGPNIAQAVNIATKSWIPWGINAKKCCCLNNQVHLDVSPLVAAFREDLLSHLVNGGVVATPDILRGLQLLRDEVVKSPIVRQSADNPVHGRGPPSFKCPVETCTMTFPQNVNQKCNMVKHVKTTHRPIMESSQLLMKINNIFSMLSGSLKSCKE